MFDYSVQSVNDATRPVWKSKVNDEMLKIYGGQVSVDEGLKNCNDIINQAIAELIVSRKQKTIRGGRLRPPPKSERSRNPCAKPNPSLPARSSTGHG